MENPSNIVPDQLIVLEGDAGLVPKASSGDVGKVLGVLNSSGDVGWVPDQEGMAQVQADWDQTDSSQVSYIANKPDLSVYATTSAMNTALAGKQNVISDLADIRAGATAGSTAVQPAALEAYATTSAMNTALAGKQNTISDLDTIRSGAALGATAAQPSDLPSSDELLPSASSGDAGKILSVDSNGDPEWITPSAGSDVVTANGNFKLGGSVPVKVNYTGTTEYDRASLQLVNTFASGTYAVAVFEIVGAHSIYYETYGNATVTLSEAIDIAGSGESDFAISYLNSDSDWNIHGLIYKNPAPTITDGKVVAQSLSFYSINPYLTGSYLGVGIKVTNNYAETEKINAAVQQLANGAVSISDWPTEQVLTTTIPNIPDSTSADANKVLTVDAQGAPQWITPSAGTVYTPGDGVDIDNNNKITVKSQPLQFISGPSFDYQPTTYYTFSDPAYRYTAAVQVKVNSLSISTSYCGGNLVLVFGQDLREYISINATGISQSTGWTVLAFDSTDPVNNYAYASESYAYVSGSGNQMDIAAAYNPKDKYYVFTFRTSNAHGTISGNPCICLVPKPNEGFTGTSPWGVPAATITATGVYTNSGQWVGVPTSGSGLVDKTYLNLRYALPSFNKISDAGKVLQVQSDGTLAWVTLS